MSSIGAFKDGPELFIGLVGAVGTDLDRVTKRLSDSLSKVGYQSHPIRLAALMRELPEYRSGLNFESEDKYIDSHMSQGNELRRKTGQSDAMAILGMGEIQKLRLELGGSNSKPLGRHAYILRSLKHPDEVATLRRVYNEAFYLVAAYAPHDRRRDNLAQRIARSKNETQASKLFPEAERLILRDQEEMGLPTGRM